ncbi:lipocalin / cytosolic fatty-acid binding protein family domain-containing protein [Ditylenchus destructor]|uniref:Lipocalin / cytosolic fatty-acid binding protein family domain-containing protein n=1 Tax=Ditylenchus destructor TaxID=166010 RepID=A0AAD4RAG8_9BILA|nr:lipocalin / cytosolic fatty-acid binding protein family domain-containing protein [Ditylenchus destructor]
MAEQFVGKWNLVESENFDAYMKQVGVGLVTRKIAANLKPVLDFTVDGDHWKMVSTSTFKTVVTEFDLGKEFDETTADGRVLKSVFTWDGSKLVQTQTKIDPKDKDSRFERYIQDGKLIITMESEGVTAKRVYEKAS